MACQRQRRRPPRGTGHCPYFHASYSYQSDAPRSVQIAEQGSRLVAQQTARRLANAQVNAARPATYLRVGARREFPVRAHANAPAVPAIAALALWFLLHTLFQGYGAAIGAQGDAYADAGRRAGEHVARAAVRAAEASVRGTPTFVVLFSLFSFLAYCFMADPGALAR